MLTAIVLVCSIALTPDLADCDRSNATDVMIVPEQVAFPVMCLQYGQEYVAKISIGDHIGADDRVKIMCVPTRKLDKAAN